MTWTPRPGEEGAFVDAWRELATFVGQAEGVGTLRMTRNVSDPSHFISFACWESAEAYDAWKAKQAFTEGLARVRAHVITATPADFEVVATVGGQPRPPTF